VQVLEPHWEKKAAEVVALERATLYGIVIYSNRKVNFGRVDTPAAREIFIRQALVEGEWETPLPFLAHNRKLIAQVQELEHKARRQDVLVDDELIHAFYDKLLPPDVCSGATLEKWFREEVKRQPRLLQLTRDGLTVTVPIYALNQVHEDRCDWLVPGLLKDKVLALIKSLHQKPRARLLPLPDWAQGFVERTPFGEGALMDVLLAAVRAHTQVDVKRNDFKLDMVAPHLFMNLRLVDEHGRQLAMGRHLATLKAEWGAQARGAFQALAALKVKTVEQAVPAPAPAASRTGTGTGTPAVAVATPPASVSSGRHTRWDFGELPELMELKKGGQVLIGFPALVDKGTHVEIEVFDEPDAAAAKHRAGLRRLVALAIKEPLKYLEKNIPDLQKMAVAYMPLGSLEELREQIIDVALDRAFLTDPLPTDSAAFERRVTEGRARLNLIAQEVARLCGTVLVEYAAAMRKLKDARPPKDVADDIGAQLQRLCGKRFVQQTPWAQLQHLPRYLKAIVLRLDKQRADPARDAQRLAELRPLDQRFVRRLADLKGTRDARLDEYRWLLEELRVSLFAQELRTPQPVSAKRLEKVWGQLSG
jgi:ATP-dependent helicase HrpA